MIGNLNEALNCVDYTGVDVRIASAAEALALLDEMLAADTAKDLDVPLKALRDAIARGDV
jgi:hypothetical protein